VQQNLRVTRWQTFTHAFFLVLGFSLIFTVMGASVGLVGYALYDFLPLIVRVGGALLVVFGLRVAHIDLKKWQWLIAAALVGAVTYYLDQTQLPLPRLLDALLFATLTLTGLSLPKAGYFALAAVAVGLDLIGSHTLIIWRVVEALLIGLIVAYGNQFEWFDEDIRFEVDRKRGRSYATSFLVGIVFAAGWTPCVGPILAGILLLAGNTQSVGQGALLLAVYSAGLGLPFLLTGALFSYVVGFLPRLRRWLPVITVASGLLLLLIGIAIFTDSLRTFASFNAFVNVDNTLASQAEQGITLLIAFLAGLASFLSPCVLPLVPAYIGYLSGAAVGISGGDSSS